MTVLYWDQRGSDEQPWRPNYLYILRSDGPLVRCGYNPEYESFQVVIQYDDLELRAEHPRADEALEHAQLYCDERIPSVWLWRLVNDRDADPRPRRVETRHHEPPGNHRYAA